MVSFQKNRGCEPKVGGASLVRCLSAFDLTIMGVGAIVGAGIFVVTGVVAATQTGPSIVISYIIQVLPACFQHYLMLS